MDPDLKSSEKDIVIVTGGSGFIGSSVIKRLSEKYTLISLDKGEGSKDIPESYNMDIGSKESIESALTQIRNKYGNKITSVIHLAAYYDFSGKESPLYDKITVEGTKNFLSALQKFEVKQFVFSSSLLVYEPSIPGQKITEESPLLPKWAYPESKVNAEKIIDAERKNVPSVILRIAGVYNDNGSSIPIANHIQRIYENQLTGHFFPGDATHGNPFIHLDDLVEAIFKVVEKRNELSPEVTINIGEPETLSYEYLQKNIGMLIHDKEFKTFIIPKPLAKAGAWVQDIFGESFIKPWMIDMADDHMELDISKAKKLLDWEPKHSLRETMPKIIAALKADPKKWYKENKLK